MSDNTPSAAAVRILESLAGANYLHARKSNEQHIERIIETELQPLIEALESLTEQGIGTEELYRRMDGARKALNRAKGEE